VRFALGVLSRYNGRVRTTATTQATATERRIFLTFLPLALMWLMMGLEGPIIAATVARLPAPKINLAAHGVAFTLGVLIHSPVIQLLAAATALGSTAGSYRRLLGFAVVLIGSLTLLHVLIGVTPLYPLLVERLMSIPRDIAVRSRPAFLVMIPSAAAVGFRRLWQGVLIRNGKAAIIPVTMLTRLGAIACSAAFFLTFPVLDGVVAGAAVGFFGLSVGCIMTYLFARPVVRDLPAREEAQCTPGSAGLVRFYVPLALTSVMMVGVRPLITLGLARSEYPLESLALWPVLTAFVFLFQSVAVSYQEVVVALGGASGARESLRRFAVKIGVVLAVLVSLVAIPPVGRFYFEQVAGVPEDLVPLTRLPVVLLVPFMALSVSAVFHRGVLVQKGRTGGISQAVGIHAAVVTGLMFAAALTLPGPGIYYAAGALTIGMAVQAVVLGRKTAGMAA